MEKVKPEAQQDSPPTTPIKSTKILDERTRIVKQRLQSSLTASSKVHDLLTSTFDELLTTRSELDTTNAELAQAKKDHAATKRLLKSEQHDHELFWRGYFYEKHEKDVRELGRRIEGLEEALERERQRGVQGGEARGKLEELRGKWGDMARIFGRVAEGEEGEKDAKKDEGGEERKEGKVAERIGVGSVVVDLGGEMAEQH